MGSRTDAVVMGLEHDHIPTEKELTIIAEAIGFNWEILGTNLGISSAAIDRIKMDNDTTVKRIQRMLIIWKQASGTEATLSRLYEVMKESPSVNINWDALRGSSPTRNTASQNIDVSKAYNQLKEQLKQDLIEFSRDQLGTTPVSPIHEQTDAPLLELYVPPTIRRIDQRVGSRSENNNSNKTTTLHEIFHETSRRCQQIYISAEAGLGKTVFAKRLALMWCEANDPGNWHTTHGQHFVDEDLRTMAKFDFVFFVSLKDTDPSDCKVDDMIQNQIINYLARAKQYSCRFVEDILTQESCLIILDGLDEWSHPAGGDCKMRISERKSNVPHKQSRRTCTFLTTTRPWKLIFANISQTKIDQQFQIVGLDKSASEELRERVTKILKVDEDDTVVSSERDSDFDAVYQNIEFLRRNPMLVMYLVCLQNEGLGFGNSMCELYSNILEMMLKRSDPESLVNDPLPEENIPRCFDENEYCQSYFVVLRELGHIAFVTLFKLSSESRLVFSSSLAKKYMPEEHLELGLRSGILTHSGVYKPLTKGKPQMSFVHKTFHDFFAALYICMEESEILVEDVLNTCKHINYILEMKSFFEFLSGFSSDRSNLVLSRLAAVVSGETLVGHFRRTTYSFLDYWELCDLLEEFQNMMVDCVNESNGNLQRVKYYVEDIIMQSKPREGYIPLLKQLLRHVRLIKIGRSLLTDETHNFLEELELFKPQYLQVLEKLDIWGTPYAEDIDRLLRGSSKNLKCLLLHGCNMVDNKETDAYMQFSDLTIQILQSLECLDSIDLFAIEMRHHHVDELVKWLEQRTCMTQIKLSRIKCSDHRGFESDCKAGNRPFDLSRHKHLTILGLGTMKMPALSVCTSSLEECWLERNENVIMYFLDNVEPSSTRLHTLVVEFVENQNIVQAIVKFIPKVIHLRNLQLKCMDFEDRDLILTQSDTLRHVRLIEITITITALEEMIEFLKICNNPITTELAACVVRSGTDNETNTYENLKQKIEKSSEFDVLPNMRCSGHDNAFAFKTHV